MALARPRGSIRNLILVPMVGLTVVLVGLTGLACGTWAAARAWDERIERGRQVVETLERSNFPLTDAVLDQLHGLGGSEFALLDAQGVVRKATRPDLLGARGPDASERGERGFRSLWNAGPGGPAYRAASVTRRGADDDRASRLVVLLPEPALQAASWEAARTVFGLTVLGACVAALIATAVGRALAAPLIRIATALRQIGRGEPVAAGLPRDRPDEIGELADAVSRLGERLATLERERAEAQRLQLVRQLSAGLAHELRNPLTAARMTLQLLERRYAQDRPLSEPLRLALAELGRMERQVKRFLQIARPDPPRFDRVDARALIADAVGRVSAAFELRWRRVEVAASDDAPTLRADPDQIGQVLVNLLQNALDATPADVPVRVGAVAAGGRALIRVDDGGPGVAEAVADRLFQPFVTTKPEGVGLGLALCASLVREHDGRLTYQRVGSFTRFQVELPLVGRDPVDTPADRPGHSTRLPTSSIGAASAWPT